MLWIEFNTWRMLEDMALFGSNKKKEIVKKSRGMLLIGEKNEREGYLEWFATYNGLLGVGGDSSIERVMKKLVNLHFHEKLVCAAQKRKENPKTQKPKILNFYVINRNFSEFLLCKLMGGPIDKDLSLRRNIY